MKEGNFKNRCRDCAYIGDSKSFPVPNDLVPGKLYCCCGDSDLYGKETQESEVNCNCYENCDSQCTLY